MGDIVRKLSYYLTTTIFDPIFNLVVLFGREVISVADHDLAEGVLHSSETITET